MKRTLIVTLMMFVGSVAQAATIFTDDFNRADGAIGNGWIAEGVRPWNIVGNKVESGGVSSGPDHELFQTTAGVETLNSAAGNGFTLSGLVNVNVSEVFAWAGVFVNGDPNAGTGVTFRLRFDGTVQLLRPNGTPIVSQVGVIPGFVPTRAYRMTISSDTSNVYDLEVFDTVAATVVYTNNGVVNGGGSNASDGVGGFWANQPGMFFDDFSLTTVPEPATAMLLIGGLGMMVVSRRRR